MFNQILTHSFVVNTKYLGLEEERIPKKVLNGTFHNTRPVGRPRTRWADMVQRDALQLLGVRGWRRGAESRDK